MGPKKLKAKKFDSYGLFNSECYESMDIDGMTSTPGTDHMYWRVADDVRNIAPLNGNSQIKFHAVWFRLCGRYK